MKIAVCATLYEAGRPFLADFLAGLRAAAAGRDVVFVAAVDGLAEPQEALAPLAGHVETVSVEVPEGHTYAGVRRAMLAAGQRSGADVLVFIDMDDVLAPDGLDRHLDALLDADFSYGDMELIDADGTSLERRFFDHAAVPGEVEDIAAIRDRNFLGFSNTAVRTTRIAPVALIVPDGIVAADWWFFTMLLLGGLRGKKTAAPVASYRIHGANALGAGAPQTVADAINQAEAMLRHYRAFSALPALAQRAVETEEILAKLRCVPGEEPTANLGAPLESAGAWFESIGRIAKTLAAPALDAAAAQ